jgi:CYTH domain-containing protein
VIEREFRYLVNRRSVDHLLGTGVSISQGYLVADGSLAIRVRRRGEGVDRRNTLTVKSTLTDLESASDTSVKVGSERHEVEIALTEQQADDLWPLCGTRIITKTRHVVDLAESGLSAEVDVFAGQWEGLVMVEVEFADRSQMATFKPPHWFGCDVTSDPRFTNAGLAMASPHEVARLRVKIHAECGTGL